MSKIGSFENRSMSLGIEKTVARPGEAGARTAAGKAAAGAVRITDQARRLAALEQAVQSAPLVNEARVAEVRNAIESGRYEVSPQRIADKLLRLEQELKAAGN